MAGYLWLKCAVSNRGVPPDDFLDRLVEWGAEAPGELFEQNAVYDIYSSISGVLGPYNGLEYRRGVMLEVMRVLAGLESSWNWGEGRDLSIPPGTLATEEAGAFQVSADSMAFGRELESLVRRHTHPLKPATFIAAMRSDPTLAME